jgi:hypothetical protein
MDKGEYDGPFDELLQWEERLSTLLQREVRLLAGLVEKEIIFL